MRERTLAQYLICRWVRENHTGAEMELVNDYTVKMTEGGTSQMLSVNMYGDILDLSTRDILGR
ncbi:MAG: hypothetical protein LUC90_04225 [Lachnospiraceae bacterium]|nr:hypothetical protein [Lachnospiraceae bacterium]